MSTVVDDFQGTSSITLQANDTKVPYTFTFGVCSSATANDGMIPYGMNVSSIAVTAYNSDGTPNTSLISGTPTVASNVVTCKLNWPGATGTYKLTFVVTLDNADPTKREADFKRIYAIDR
ncbi:MAG: hypothetical protein PHN44_10915 [Candidatus Marinimicrobia bacterium]|nr:hypothetical protein [Candidatus Neomarinimicrobiota bacterium]